LVHSFAEESNTGLQLTAIYFDSKDSPYANLDRVQYGMNSSRDSIFARCFLAGVMEKKKNYFHCPYFGLRSAIVSLDNMPSNPLFLSCPT
jgi:hypothetical protein